MASQKIRIKLAAYDHELVDQAASRIVETMQKGGAKVSGPIPLPTEREVVTILRCPHKYKDFPRAVRAENVQADHRHLFAQREASGFHPPSRRRRHQSKTVIR